MTVPVTTASAGTGQLAVDQLGHLGQGQRDHAGVPSRSREDLAQHVAVVEGVHGAGDLLAGLVPLAGDEQRVAGPGQRDGGGQGARGGRRPRAPRRARSSGTSWTPASIAARMAAGSSERGLSSVTIEYIAAGRRSGPHRRPLSRIPVAAAAQHGDQPAGSWPPAARRGRC